MIFINERLLVKYVEDENDKKHYIKDERDLVEALNRLKDEQYLPFEVETFENALNQIKQRSDKVADSVRNVAKKAPGLLDKVASKVSVKQSPINDFVIEFKNELMNKLNILDEIHNEQLRHNNISEEFYSALLNMVAIMAKSQGNSRVASQLDAMVKQVSR